MAKTTKGPGEDFQFILRALTHIKELNIDFKTFAEAENISIPNNARKKFKELLKKHGFKLENGQVTSNDQVDDPSPTTPKKRKASPEKEAPARPMKKKAKAD